MKITKEQLKDLIRENLKEAWKGNWPPPGWRGKKEDGQEIEEKKEGFQVQCMECGKKFTARSMSPTCPKCKSSDVDILEEVSPPGFHGTVRAMKTKHGDEIDNPYALAWSMKDKGYEPHYKDQETSLRGTPRKKEKFKREALDPIGQEDKDVNNDGKTNAQDKYLKHRRGVVARKVKKEACGSNPVKEARINMGFFSALNANDQAVVEEFLAGERHELPGRLFSKAMEYYADEMPYGTMKARTGDPDVWLRHRLERELDLAGIVSIKDEAWKGNWPPPGWRGKKEEEEGQEESNIKESLAVNKLRSVIRSLVKESLKEKEDNNKKE